MKPTYSEAELEIIEFESEDVITTSLVKLRPGADLPINR